MNLDWAKHCFALACFFRFTVTALPMKIEIHFFLNVFAFGVVGGKAKEIWRKENAKKSLWLTDADIPGDLTLSCIVHLLCTTQYNTSVQPFTVNCTFIVYCTEQFISTSQRNLLYCALYIYCLLHCNLHEYIPEYFTVRCIVHILSNILHLSLYCVCTLYFTLC